MLLESFLISLLIVGGARDVSRVDVARKLHEYEGYRQFAYQDHLGNWTIGIGRNIQEPTGKGVSPEEARVLLMNDIDDCELALSRNIPWWSGLPAAAQDALLMMCFQLGIGGLLKFKKMLKALKEGDWEAAHREALDSMWAAQTPRRARETAAMFLGEQDA